VRRAASLLLVLGIFAAETPPVQAQNTETPLVRAQNPEPARTRAGTDSLTLARAIRLALHSHPSVAAAVAGERESEAGVREARAAWFPGLSAGGTVTRYQKASITQPFHGLTPGAAPSFDQTSIQGRLALDYTVWDGGARGARIAGAHALAAAADADAQGVRMNLAARVAGAFLEALTGRASVDAQERRLTALGSELKRVEQLRSEGRAADVERLRVEADLSRAEAARLTAVARLDNARRELDRLIGVGAGRGTIPAPASVRLSPTAATPAALEEARPRLARAAEERSPVMRAARQRATAAHAGRDVARAAWFPRLELTGRYLSFGSGNGDYSGEWQGGLQFSYPLFTGGARSAAVARADARERSALARTRETELALEGEVDEAVTLVRESHARARALASAAGHLEEVVRIERLSLDEGVGVQTDYLRALADLAEARAAEVEARHDEIAARVQLARLTGELTADWVEQNLEAGP